MSAAHAKLDNLSANDRQTLDTWLAELKREWHSDRLAEQIGILPASGALRPVALVELVKADLQQHWLRGGKAVVEGYLRSYPELGSIDSAPLDLIVKEFEVRQAAGDGPRVSSFLKRFPRQAEQLRTVLKESPATATPMRSPVRPNNAGWNRANEDSLSAASLKGLVDEEAEPTVTTPARATRSGTGATTQLFAYWKWLAGGGVGIALVAGIYFWSQTSTNLPPTRPSHDNPSAQPVSSAPPSRSEVHAEKPAEIPEPPSESKLLADVLVEGSSWKGAYAFKKFDSTGRLELHIQKREGDTFRAVHLARRVEDGVPKRFLRPVRGTVQGAALSYRASSPELQFSVVGNWNGDDLDIEQTEFDGNVAIGDLERVAMKSRSAREVFSVFDQDDNDGWYTKARDGSPEGTDPIEVRSFSGNHYLATRGKLHGPDWGWHAPAKYHGDHAKKFGHYLIYEIFTSLVNEKAVATDSYVSLRGGGMTIYLDSTNLETPRPGVWKMYCIRLDRSGGWKNLERKAPATDEEIKKVLADVQDLRFKGEYGIPYNIGCLDSIEFGSEEQFRDVIRPPPPPPAPMALTRDVIAMQGKWRIDGEDVVQDSERLPAFLLFGDVNWMDYDFELEAKKIVGTAAEGFIVPFRARPGNQWMVNVGGGPKPWRLLQVVRDGKLAAPPAAVSGRDTPDPEWCKVLIKVRGQDFQCFVNGVQALGGRFKDHPRGGVGLQTHQTAVRFRHIKVTAPNGTVLFTGLPLLPSPPTDK